MSRNEVVVVKEGSISCAEATEIQVCRLCPPKSVVGAQQRYASIPIHWFVLRFLWMRKAVEAIGIFPSSPLQSE
jgi:hypothetical protein